MVVLSLENDVIVSEEFVIRGSIGLGEPLWHTWPSGKHIFEYPSFSCCHMWLLIQR